MKYPSKRTAEIAGHEVTRQQAIHDNDVEAFAAAVAEIKRLEAEPDVYTCLCCGDDFGNEAHVELLVAAALVFDINGVATERYDYGIKDTAERKAGRRIKFCGDCAAEWHIALADYLEMR